MCWKIKFSKKHYGTISECQVKYILYVKLDFTHRWFETHTNVGAPKIPGFLLFFTLKSFIFSFALHNF